MALVTVVIDFVVSFYFDMTPSADPYSDEIDTLLFKTMLLRSISTNFVCFDNRTQTNMIASVKITFFGSADGDICFEQECMSWNCCGCCSLCGYLIDNECLLYIDPSARCVPSLIMN